MIRITNRTVLGVLATLVIASGSALAQAISADEGQEIAREAYIYAYRSCSWT
jgi:hypothetical protein